MCSQMIFIYLVASIANCYDGFQVFYIVLEGGETHLMSGVK